MKSKTKKKTPRELPEEQGEFAPFVDAGRAIPRAGAQAAIARTDLYFAYGSNMNLEQMARRCPRARMIGPAKLVGWKLVARGCADVEPAKHARVFGAAWRLTAQCVAALDRYEGFPAFYTRDVVLVDLDDGRRLFAWVYFMTPEHQRTTSPLSYGYALGCAEGARQCGTTVDPIFLHEIQYGPRDASRRPWSPAREPMQEPREEPTPPRVDLPAFAREAVLARCKPYRLSPTKLSNVLACSTYNRPKRQVRVAGEGVYLTIDNVGPRNKRPASEILPPPTLDELDALEADAKRTNEAFERYDEAHGDREADDLDDV